MHILISFFILCYNNHVNIIIARLVMKSLVVKCENGLRFAHEKTTIEELKTRPISIVHAHKAYEIYYLKSGDVKYTISDKIIKVESGSIVVINAYVLHKVDVTPTENYERYVLECPINNVPVINGVSPLNRFFNTNRFVNIIPKEMVEQSNALKILERMEEEWSPDDIYNNHILQSNILLYVIEIAKLIDEEQKINYNFIKTYDKNSATINSVIQYINDNVKSKITVESIAREMNFSKSYLQHIFKKSIGIPISQYILMQKMQTANFLLEEGFSIKAVAYELGYKYYPTFFSAYKKFFGYCPKERKKEL